MLTAADAEIAARKSFERITGMAADPNPALRAELNAALDVLAPQIRGLHDLAAVSISADLAASVAEQIVERERRRDLLNAAIATLDAGHDAMNALEADGYPALPDATIIASQFNELQEQSSDLDTAIGIFAEQASKGTVVLGTPTAKPDLPTQKG